MAVFPTPESPQKATAWRRNERWTDAILRKGSDRRKTFSASNVLPRSLAHLERNGGNKEDPA
jgi:hypothetical protein